MVFVVTEELKVGMRLAKPIYNKNGVLLYERDSKLTTPGINSIRNFGLIGVYILEPAEPVPPLTREDLEFEQLQTVYIFRLREIMDNILARKKLDTLNSFIDDIIRHYGKLNHRVNFNQNLRSADDFMYKHAISTAILVTMLTSHLGYTYQKQKIMIAAALLYGLGFRYVSKLVLEKGEDLDASERDMVQRSLERGLDFLSNYRGAFDYFPRMLALIQVFVYHGTDHLGDLKPDEDLQHMHMILRVADQFDRSTAMNIGHHPESEIKAMQYLMDRPNDFHPDYVDALQKCIHICPVGASVDFTNGTKGIVIVENDADFIHPVILHIANNKVYDLSLKGNQSKYVIKDIMKTMDNRIAIDEETLKHFIPDARLKEITRMFKKN